LIGVFEDAALFKTAFEDAQKTNAGLSAVTTEAATKAEEVKPEESAAPAPTAPAEAAEASAPAAVTEATPTDTKEGVKETN
jgi:hypothetical protein